MSLQQRERISRNYDKTECEGCRSSMYEHNGTLIQVYGKWFKVCTSCLMEWNKSDTHLRAYLRCRAYWGENVNDELLERL